MTHRFLTLLFESTKVKGITILHPHSAAIARLNALELLQGIHKLGKADFVYIQEWKNGRIVKQRCLTSIVDAEFLHTVFFD